MTQQRKLEDYLKTIYLLQRKGTVRGADIAEELNVKRPTVSVSLKELEQEGYLIRLKDRSVILTFKGAEIAREIADRNRGIYELLVALGISKAVAMRDACNMEHALSQESFFALISLQQSFQKGGGTMIPLGMSVIGEENIIRRIGGSPEMKKHLEDMGFTAGSAVTVISTINGNLIVKVKESRVAISKEMAARIMV